MVVLAQDQAACFGDLHVGGPAESTLIYNRVIFRCMTNRLFLMKSPLIKTILLVAALAALWSPLRAEDGPLSYTPAVVTLTGTIFQESYGDDPPSPRYRGHQAWILRLERPIALRGVPGDKLDVDAANIKEVALNVDHTKYPIAKNAFKKTRFVVTGTLYQPGTTNFLRSVVLYVSDMQSASHK